jgi:hypothetical protein
MQLAVSCAWWWMRCDGLAMHNLLCMVFSPPAAVACRCLGARVVNPPQVHALQSQNMGYILAKEMASIMTLIA